MTLEYNVINQRITSKCNNYYAVADSVNYLKLDFTFTADWQGFSKLITFRNGLTLLTIEVEDSCIVPWEVIKTPSFIFSIVGTKDGVVITTDTMKVIIKPSGETQGVTPSDPPKQIYDGLQNGLKGQVLGKVSDDNYDYDFQNLKDLQYDNENTLGEILEELVVDAVTDIKYEDGYLKKVENGETTNVVEMYDKQGIDDLLENLDQYIEKSDTPGLVKNDGTIDTTEYATQNDLDSAKSNLQGDISNEENARINADTQLQGLINDEKGARQNVDTQLQTNIDAEASARGSADTTLQGNIDSESLARQNADTALGGRIDTEITDRTTAISNEALARQQADTNEATIRQQEDEKLQNAINTKTQEITIINQQITNWFINENQEFSNYAYVSNTTIQDLINAKYVNVSFSLSDLEANNICPIQVVDNTLGVLTIYSNDNSSITISYIYIFK